MTAEGYIINRDGFAFCIRANNNIFARISDILCCLFADIVIGSFKFSPTTTEERSYAHCEDFKSTQSAPLLWIKPPQTNNVETYPNGFFLHNLTAF